MASTDKNYEVVLTVDIIKYPFLKLYRVGDTGNAKFTGEIIEQGRPDDVPFDDDDDDEEDDEEDEDDEKNEIHSIIKISDLKNNRETARKGVSNDRN